MEVDKELDFISYVSETCSFEIPLFTFLRILSLVFKTNDLYFDLQIKGVPKDTIYESYS